jgi:hypothetical protein
MLFFISMFVLGTLIADSGLIAAYPNAPQTNSRAALVEQSHPCSLKVDKQIYCEVTCPSSELLVVENSGYYDRNIWDGVIEAEGLLRSGLKKGGQ